MAKEKAFWGIDLGNCALKAFKLVVAESDEVMLAGYDYIEHGKILTQPEADTHELIAKSLEKFLSRNDITEDQVVISVSGQHTLSRFSKLPPVEPKKIPDIVQFEANQQIPFDMDEVIWDYQTFMEEDSPEIEVGIFAMKRELIHEHLAHFGDVGIEPILVQSAPLALFDALLHDGQLSEKTTIIIDVGAANTDLVITDRIRLWTRTIPIGGNNFTTALANGFKLSFAKAENLKRQASTSKYARQIFQAMRPIFADLVGEIQRSIGFYTSTHRDADLDRMVGMGNAFKLPGLQKYLQQNLSMEVIRPSGFDHIKVSSNVSSDYKDQILSLGVAYGLALEGLDRGVMHNSLLPTEVARQVAWRKKKPWFATAAACLLLCSGLIWWRYQRDMSVLASNRGDADTIAVRDYASAVSVFQRGPDADSPREYSKIVLQMGQAFQNRYRELEPMGVQDQQSCEAILQLLRDRSLWPKILTLLHSALPEQQLQLASADDGVAYVKSILEDRGKLKRSLRKEVFIEEFNSQFSQNVYSVDYRESLERAEGRDLFDYYDEKGAPGFRILLKCRTPYHENGKYIESEFIPRLEEMGQKQGLGFYFDGFVLDRGSDHSAHRPGVVRPMPGSRGRPMERGIRPSAPMPTAPSSGGAKSRDPLTLEDEGGDWHFGLHFVVVVRELPEQQTPGTPEATTESTAPGRGRRSGRGEG